MLVWFLFILLFYIPCILTIVLNKRLVSRLKKKNSIHPNGQPSNYYYTTIKIPNITHQYSNRSAFSNRLWSLTSMFSELGYQPYYEKHNDTFPPICMGLYYLVQHTNHVVISLMWNYLNRWLLQLCKVSLTIIKYNKMQKYTEIPTAKFERAYLSVEDYCSLLTKIIHFFLFLK